MVKILLSIILALGLILDPYAPTVKKFIDCAETYAEVYADGYATAMVEYWFCQANKDNKAPREKGL